MEFKGYSQQFIKLILEVEGYSLVKYYNTKMDTAWVHVHNEIVVL